MTTSDDWPPFTLPASAVRAAQADGESLRQLAVTDLAALRAWAAAQCDEASDPGDTGQ